jgi:branched-chain amino acid transport system substrate-binding protein
VKRTLTACLTSALLLAGCSAAPPENQDTTSDELVIGVVTAQSGALAPYDQPALRGLQIRVDEINAENGVDGKTKIRLIVKDTRSDAAQSSIVAQELLGEGVNLLVTPCDADPSIAAGQLAQAASIPAISLCASTPTLPGSVGDFMFSNFPGDNLQAWAAADYAKDQGFRRAFVLKSPDSAYTNALPEYFVKAFTAMGGEVVGQADYSMGQQNFDAVISRIRAVSPPPDVIETAAYEPDFPAFLKALRGAGLTTPVIGADAIDTPTTLALGEIANGVVFTTAGVQEPGNPVDEFEQKYIAKYGEPSGTVYAPVGYDLGLIIEAATKNANGDLSGPSLRDAIASIKDLQGITSPITYEGTDGMPIRNSFLVRIDNGARVALGEVTPDPAQVPAP